MYKITTHQHIRTLTNRITYNRLLRSTKNILNHAVFEFNDGVLRTQLSFKLGGLYKRAVQDGAINGFDITISDFDKAKPHYIELDIVISLPNMIEYVIINIYNENI